MKYEIIPISSAMLELIERQHADIALQPFSREIMLLSVKLSNTPYTQETEQMIAEMPEGTVLQLLRTPSGDELEISAMLGDRRVGTIPMDQNAVIARLMDAGKILTCRVSKASVERDFMSHRPWIRILVKIYLID